MANPKIFIFAPEKAGTLNAPLQRLQDVGCEIVEGKASWMTPQGNNEDEMRVLARNADALLGTSIRSTPITRSIMEVAPDLRIVSKYTVGIDDVDVEAATSLGILVTHSPTEANWGGVAEGTVAMMLAVLKKVRERDAVMKSGRWRTSELEAVYLGSRRQDGWEGITIGLIGLGRIGRRLCELLKPWRVHILACDPYVDKAQFALSDVIEADLDTVLSQSDVVTLHCSLNETSRKIINRQTLARMKPTAVFLNAARGALVDEPALIEALQKGVIASAALDVFASEPLEPDSPLLDLGDKVLLSAHMVTSNLGSGIGPGAKWAGDYVERALRGELPDHIVNPEVIERWLERFGGKPLIASAIM
jgi:phosphoglycerate dehydrogenase-like enzyme